MARESTGLGSAWDQMGIGAALPDVAGDPGSAQGGPGQRQQRALETRRRSTCRRQTAGAAHSFVGVISPVSSRLSPRPHFQASHPSPRLRIHVRIHQVLTRSTPPRWRVAVQQAGADAGTHDLRHTVDQGCGKVNRPHLTCPAPQVMWLGSSDTVIPHHPITLEIRRGDPQGNCAGNRREAVCWTYPPSGYGRSSDVRWPGVSSPCLISCAPPASPLPLCSRSRPTPFPQTRAADLTVCTPGSAR